MRRERDWPAAATAWVVVAAVVAVGCSDRDDGRSLSSTNTELSGSELFPATSAPGGDFLFQVGRAFETASSYRVSATQENLVLPRWGGSDGGTVSVDLKASAAAADLRRTGDGQYAVLLKGGETFFKRSTCSTWTKIQDAKDVLAPFVFRSDRLTSSKLLEVLPTPSNGNWLVTVDLQGLGKVNMEIDPKTARPLRVASDTVTNNGKRLE